jgi:chaperonin GroES
MKQLKQTFKLEDIITLPNIAEKMDEEDLSRLASEVISSVDLDIQSRSDWERLTEKALDLIELKHEMKHNPWPNASSVKYPLVSTAVIQFASRQMPTLIRNGKVAEVQVIGSDPDGSKMERASRVSKHMSYQLLHEMEEWEDELDKMLHMLASVGTVFKKTYYDPVKRRPVSQLCLYDEIIINDDVKSLEDARRVTHKVSMHKNDIIERMRLGLYSELTADELDREAFESLQQESIHEVLEQHCYIDLDGDGYEEPYIVLVDRDLAKVLRVVARYDQEDIDTNDKDQIIRIRPIQHFTDFHFIRSPKGKFYSIGFGQLLYSLNHSVNTILNQLIDAGTLANTQSGIMDKRLRIPGGQFDMVPGTFQKANLAGIEDIRKHMLPLDFKEPSNVLFQLLGTLVEATKEVSSVSDALTGQENAQNVAATTMLALIEQGSKVFSAIQKRIYMGMKKEFKKLFRLNRIFLDRQEYFRVLDDEAVISNEDYIEADLDIMPVADPSVSSDAHRLARTQAQMQLVGQPGVNSQAIMKQFLEDLNTPEAMIQQILPEPDPNAPPPIEVLEKQSEIQERGQKLEIQAKELQLENMRSQGDLLLKNAEIKLKEAQALKAIAEAEAAELGPQLALYKAQLDELTQQQTAKMNALIQAKDPETNFGEEDVQRVVGDEDEQGLPGAGTAVEDPRGI